ncbi:MAG: PaaI family thioesterase [Spirochaetia bacterium]|nr:PaaI family thioesterase [Spirochaetia bacterium]
MKVLRKQKDLSFGTSPDNDQGLKLNLEFDEDTKTAYGETTLAAHFQGHKADRVHPGIIALMLDEVMMKINQSMNLEVQTGEFTVRYLQQAKTNEPVYLRGYFVKKNKKIIENRAELEDDIGKIIARAKGKYIEIDPLDEA